MTKEYSVFITNIYLPWEHAGTVLYLRKNPERHAYHIKHVSKALDFTFFNMYLTNQKSKCVFVVFLCVAASQILKIVGWELQWAVCCHFFIPWLGKLYLYHVSLNLIDPNSHSVPIFVENIVPYWLIKPETYFEIKFEFCVTWSHVSLLLLSFLSF